MSSKSVLPATNEPAWKQRLLNHPLAWVNGGALIACWLFGAYHAWQEHASSTALKALLLPPYGVYMAIEFEMRHKNEVKSIMRGVDGNVAREQLCLDDDATYRKSGLTREQYDIWCECTAQMIEAGLAEEIARFGEGSQSGSKRKSQIAKRARQSCYSTARYLGMPIQDGPGADEGAD